MAYLAEHPSRRVPRSRASRRGAPLLAPLAVVALALQAVGCGSGGADGERPGGYLPGTAGRVQRLFEEELMPAAPGYRDAAERLLSTVVGGEPDGVELRSFGDTIRTGTVAADLDGDGERETLLSVGVTLASAEPAPTDPIDVTIGQGGPGDPGLLSGTARLRFADDGSLTVTGAFASFEYDYVSVFADEGSGALPATPEPGAEVGSMRFRAFDPEYVEIIEGTFRFEVTGQDGFRIRVVVDDDPETPEDESAAFVVE